MFDVVQKKLALDGLLYYSKHIDNAPEGSMENAINEFSAKVQQVTGRAVRQSEIAHFVEQAQTVIAHRQGRSVQVGFCDFQTVSGRAELVEVAF